MRVWHYFMAVPHNIFLVGLMGSGKTTIGRALAKKLNKRFVDSDHEIEARTGASIPLIFEIEGEKGFRQREAEIIRELTARNDIVLATGGGAILNAENRAFLKERGTVIYLRASVNSILQRTSHDKNRPLLQPADTRKRIEELARQREPYFREVADIIVETGRPYVLWLVNVILSEFESIAGNSASSSGQCSADAFNSSHSNMNKLQFAPITLQVDLGERSYPIAIGSSLLHDADRFAKCIAGERVAIVTNTFVFFFFLSL